MPKKKQTLKGAVKGAVTSARAEQGIPVSGAKVASEVAEEVKANPVLQNELNQEPWWQSGVGFFGTGGVLWAIGVLLTEWSEHGSDFENYDQKIVWAAAGSLFTAAMVLYRRFWPGLKPMFHWVGK